MKRIFFLIFLATVVILGSKKTWAIDDVTIEFGKKERIQAVDNVPDAPARAFIDDQGYVVLYAAGTHVQRYRGTNLNTLVPDSGFAYVSDQNAVPRMYADKEWLYSPYTENGRDVYSLVHNEYHGWEHDNCVTQSSMNCWWNVMTLIKSYDGGRSFAKVSPAPNHVVIAPVVDYNPDNRLGPIGHMEATNIIKKGNYYYATVGQVLPYLTNYNGRCLIRTNNLSSSDGWEAYNSKTGTFQTIPADGKYVCEVLNPSPGGYSWNYSTYLKKYIHYTAHWNWGGSYSLSDDLTNWGQNVVWFTKDKACIYGSFIQPGSESRNFDNIGRSPWLYYTTCESGGCVPGCNNGTRVLERVRVRMSKLGESNKYDLLDLQFNEKRGRDVLDSSFYVNDGRINGSNVSFVEEGVSNYLHKESSESYISVPDSSSLDVGNGRDMSIVLRIKTNQTPSAYVALLAKEQDYCAGRNYGVWMNKDGKLHFSYTGLNSTCQGSLSSRSINDNNWHVVNIIYINSEKKVYYYIDGILDKVSQFTVGLGNVNNAPVIIGAGFVGDIDYLTIYNYPTIQPVSATPTPTATSTPRPVATSTPTPTATSTPRPVATSTPTPTPTPTQTPTPVLTLNPTPSCIQSNGDFNKDGAVNITDLVDWYSVYRGNYNVGADFNCDNKVDINDLLIWYGGYRN